MPTLREAVDRAPNARRFQLYESAAGEGEGLQLQSSLAGEGQGGGHEVTVVASPITDTCKEVVDGLVRRTVPRDTLVEVTGPWMFRRQELVQALDHVGRDATISNLVELCRVASLQVRLLIRQ
jgi:2-C-methyl-D-erythritol 4-phosphate cytidylyltransferase